MPLSPEMEKWIEMRQKNGDFLMVRSTGAEDSKQLTNAGGNVSIPYVPADTKKAASAIGEVVKSYFERPQLPAKPHQCRSKSL